MNIDLIDDLLQTSSYLQWLSLKINHLVIDTGTAHSLPSPDNVSQIGIKNS